MTKSSRRLDCVSIRDESSCGTNALADDENVYFSNPVETHPLFGQFYLTLNPNGEGTLRLDRTGENKVDWLIAIWRRGMLRALLMTLIAESLVVIGWAVTKKLPLKKLVPVCLFVNIVSLPCVWVVTLVAFGLTGSIGAGLFMLALAEVTAVIFEGAIYLTIRGVPKLAAFAIALLANGISFGIGIVESQVLG